MDHLTQAETIPLQVGSELTIDKTGALRLSNPTIEPGPNENAADAVITYRFNRQTGEHIIRLVDPLAHRGRR